MSHDLNNMCGACSVPTSTSINLKYKAKIASVSPGEHRYNFELSEHCFLGISLENSHFHPEKLASIVQWISRRFTQCTVLVGDSIHRLTLQSVHDMHPSIALTTALQLGKRFVGESQPVFEHFRALTQFRFITCQGVQALASYQHLHAQLTHLYRADAAFSQSVKCFAEHYLRKRLEASTPAEWARKVGFSTAYFLEEFAIFACLQQQGHSVMIYPGSFSTLSEIAQGLHPQAPDELKALTIVSLCLKGR